MRTTVLSERNPDKYKKILGIDSSSLGVAWTLVDDQGPEASGKIKNLGDKIEVIAAELPVLLDTLEPDHMFVEMPIFVANPATARLLTFIAGAVLTVAVQRGLEFTLVEPTTWKSYLGVTSLSRKFQTAARDKLGKTEGNKLCDRLRKSQTQRILKNRYEGFDVEDNDISDSCAIALYGFNKLATELMFVKNKGIAFDLPELHALGLDI